MTEEGEGRTNAFRLPCSEFKLDRQPGAAQGKERGTSDTPDTRLTTSVSWWTPHITLLPASLQPGTGRQGSAPPSEASCGEQVLEGCSMGLQQGGAAANSGLCLNPLHRSCMFPSPALPEVTSDGGGGRRQHL